MITGKVTHEDGSIFPNRHGPWGLAAEKLVEADLGIALMRSAKDRVTFESGWTKFVDSTEEAWNRMFTEGKQNHRRFLGWISKPNAVRQNDELLSYITQARHQSQHGVLSLTWTGGGGISIGQGFAGTFSSLTVRNDGTFEAEAQANANSPKAFGVYFDPGTAALPTIVNKKHNQSFAPPLKHLDEDVRGIGPIAAAQLVLNFYRSVLDSAKATFPSSSS